ncbi:KxYKxGKxW signal peptide domain-containing protein [Furfurilactobacillus milii]|uniref:KxYKxGKxW signal peptide domain-containing protein n=1 Tax=Furfurilactobacillus milii TaxID=2888272 RepID=A0ABT6D9V0_9LACO|nr:KxYKxGKxW signal peptide domain-containing protein [Furfurilactobacillus milii]QLE65595.1 hypothetical protein LROSL2_0242 [Furfurilactobacillus rossiae]MCF6161138.1 FIVAR domain-containing protein [Furfurilactobacillus milii]MCF6163607.1 FIVAR domain-containing protein [Furfurilactobacillus milii]MDF9913894.1 KxYKxGKxW signal peptide domain-containing protein [Furfurilactobacillus milii]QLE68025.1 hypothetical protein LROSL3_0243 [Furfurilactobacillus rossiae]
MSRKNEEIADTITSTKEHYKMYKAGKQWLFAGITVFTFGGLLAGGEQAAKADATSNNGSNTTDPQTDATKQTNAPLEFSTSVTQTTATASAAPTSVAPASAAVSQSSVKTSTASSQSTNSQASTAPSSVASKTQTAQTSTAPASVTSQASEAQTSTASQAKDVQTSTAPVSATSAAKDVQTSTAPASVAGATKDVQTSTAPASTTSQSKTDQASQSKDATTSTATASSTSQTSDDAQTSTAPASATTNTSTVASQTSAASTAPTKQVTALPDNANSQQVSDAKSAALAAFAETGTPQEITRTDAAVTSDATTSAADTTSAATTSAAANQAWTDYSKVLAAAQAEKSANYTNASYSLLQTALANANGMTQSAAKTALKSAQQQLQAAIDSLVPNLGAGGQAQLQNTISADQTKYSNATASEYTTAAWKTYTDALSAANAGLSDSATTANTFSVLYKKLTDATAGLELNKSSVLFTQLESVTSSAATKLNDSGSYTVASIQNLQTAQSAAQKISGSSAAQDIQTATQNLQTALDALIPSGSLSSLQNVLNTTSVTYNANQTADATKTNYAYAAYTKSSWDTFASAYVYAKAVMNNGAATPDQISTSSYNLQQAYQNLLTTTATNLLLSDAIAGGDQLLEEGSGSAYGSQSTQTLKNAILAAQTLLSSDGTPLATSTPDQLNQATKVIQSAIDGLTTTTNSAWNNLNKYIQTADTLSAGDYTADTFSTLTSAISKAKSALYDDSTAASLQSDADALRSALWAATPANTTIAKAKTALSDAVKNAQSAATSSANYSTDTYQTFVNALKVAQSLLDNASMDNTAMTKATSNLTFYQGNLVNIGNSNGASFTGSVNSMNTLGTGGVLAGGPGSFNTVSIVNTSTVTFGGSSTFSGISVVPSYTSTWTLPISLTPFFKTTDWQKYVNLAYVLWSGTTQLGTGTSALSATLDPAKNEALSTALASGDFMLRVAYNNAGQPVLTLVSKSLTLSSKSSVQYYFMLDLGKWSNETNQYLPRITGNQTLNDITYQTVINGFSGTWNLATGTSKDLENTFAADSDSSITPNTPQPNYSTSAASGTATLINQAQKLVPQFTVNDLTSAVVQGTNTITGKVTLDTSTDMPGDIYQIVFTDTTTGATTTANINKSDGTFVASFGNTVGTTTTGLNINTGDQITAQIQRVNRLVVMFLRVL